MHDSFYESDEAEKGRVGSCSPATIIFVTTSSRNRRFLLPKLRFFCITSSSLTGNEAASLIVSAVCAMTRLCRQHAAGFIAKISRGPEVRIIEKARR